MASIRRRSGTHARKRGRGPARKGGDGRLAIALAVLAAIGGVVWYFQQPIFGYGEAGAAYGARVICSCRYVAGRTMADCAKDKEPGMDLVFLSDNDAKRSVTATVPLIARETATLKQGYGCVLEPWEG